MNDTTPDLWAQLDMLELRELLTKMRHSVKSGSKLLWWMEEKGGDIEYCVLIADMLMEQVDLMYELRSVLWWER